MTDRQGFATMVKTDPARQREIASKGGKAAHTRGTAHQWTSEEASAAGRKGGLVKKRRYPAVTTHGEDQTPDV